MNEKKNTPLHGYAGQPPEVTTAAGTVIPAGDLVEQAMKAYGQANPGLHESQLPLAWNNLDDARRREWCEEVVERLDAISKAGSDAADRANVMATVAPQVNQKLGQTLIAAALAEVKALSRPWQQMTADQQDEVLHRITEQVREAVGETIRALASRGAHTIECELEQITVKKGAKAVLVIGKGDMTEELLDAVGLPVLLVVGPALDEGKGIEKPTPDPDQGDLLAQTHAGDGSATGGAGVVHSDPED